MTQEFNHKKIRQDFPILSQKINGSPLIYFDSAASTQKPAIVIDAISNYYQHDHSNVHRGVHTLSNRSTHLYEGSREKVRQFINANSVKEIVFCRGTTEAINLVANAFLRPNLQSGDEIILTKIEHHSNIVPWQMVAKEAGAILKVIPINDKGELDLTNLKGIFSKKTKIVAINHISNALGTINPIKKIIQVAKENNVPVLVDGAQAMAHQSVDVQELDCDFYAFSGHKMYGPTGIGCLYGKQDILEHMSPYQGGGEMISYVSFDKTQYNVLPYKFEAGTPNISGAVGLGAAIDYLSSIGMDNIREYEEKLLSYLTTKVKEIDGFNMIGTAQSKASILSFTLDGVHAHDIGTILDEYGIAVRTGHHCAIPVMEHFNVPATARVSLSFYNTFDEIDVFIDAIEKVKKVFA